MTQTDDITTAAESSDNKDEDKETTGRPRRGINKPDYAKLSGKRKSTKDNKPTTTSTTAKMKMLGKQIERK